MTTVIVDIVRPSIILICLAGLASWIAYLRMNADWSRYAVGPMCPLSHIILFESVVILVVYDVLAIKPVYINQWSQVIWLQTSITTALYALSLICEHRYARNKH